VSNVPTEDNNNNNNNQDTPRDPEDTTFRSRMTSKGLFKSRNTQRQEELQRKRKGVPTSDIIDLTTEKKVKAAERHSIAAKTHAEGVKCQSQIAAIEQSMKMGVSAEILRPFMMKTLHTLFDTDNDKEKDDSNEVEFVRSIAGNSNGNTFVKKESYLPSACLTVTRTSCSRSDSAIPTRSNEASGGRCCAEEECVYSDGEYDGLSCEACKKQVHSFCAQPICDGSSGEGETYLCFKCVLNSPTALQMLDN
jgi:hypothetical protein